MTSTRPFLVLSVLVLLLLAAAPAGATDSTASGGGAAAEPVTDELTAPAPSAQAAQTETTPTTPGGEEQPGDQPTETGTTPDTVEPVADIPEDGAGGLPRTGIEIAGLAMIGLGLLMAGLALRPTSSWPPPPDRPSRSIRHR